MPRITAGEFKGRRLLYPAGERFRPTMDKVKEAVFSIIGEGILNARVLDLFAGAGGLGLEALSRGADQVVFVEQNPEATRCLERNIKVLGLKDRATLVRQDVRIYLRQSKFFATHVFSDPPYHSSLASETLALVSKSPDLSMETLIVLEHAKDQELTIPEGLEVKDARTYGDTSLTFLIKRKGGRT